MRRSFATLALIGVLALFAWPAKAASPLYGLGDLSRWSISGSSGWLGFKDYGSGGTGWQGVDFAPAITFSAHQSLALAANFSHGIPFDKDRPHVNIARLQAQLRLYPPIGAPDAKASLFVSAGPAWMGDKNLREWSGLNTQLAAAHSFSDHLSGFAMYAHAFGWDAASGDRDFFRVGLNLGSTLGR